MNWLERVKRKHGKICPNCKLFNPESAEECYCGYKFEIKNESQSFLSKLSMIIFTVFILLIMGFLIYTMFEGIIFVSCDRFHLN